MFRLRGKFNARQESVSWAILLLSLTMVLAGKLASPATAILTSPKTVTNNTFTTRNLVAPTNLVTNPIGHDVTLSWNAGQNGNGYSVLGVANGSNSNCSGASFGTLGSTTITAYTDTARYTPQGSYFCYQVQTTYGNWNSTTGNPIAAAQIGFFATTIQMVNGGTAGVLDPGDQVVVNFNQAVNTATGPSGSDTVCADDGFIVLGSPVGGGGSGTVKDDFEPAGGYAGNDGTQSWVGNWTEVGESDGSTAGALWVDTYVPTNGSYALELRTGTPWGGSTSKSVYREANLAGAASATLTYYWKVGASGGGSVGVYASSNGGGSWTLLTTHSLTANASGSKTLDITSYAASNTRIRFKIDSTTLFNDGIIGFDDVQIAYTSGSRECFARPMAVWSNASGVTQYNPWNGITFTVSANTASLGTITQGLQGAASPTRNEKIVIGIDAFGDVKGEVWNGSTWTLIPSGSLGSPGFGFSWAYDVAYERQSGDGLIVFADASNTLRYATWNGSSWTAKAAISDYPTLAGANPAKRVELASKPGSDEIALVATSNIGKTIAWIWNGSGWGSGTALNSTGAQNTASAIAYESLTGRIMVTYSKGFGDSKVYYRIWNGSSWLTEGNTAAPSGYTDNFNFSRLASDPKSNRIVLGVSTANTAKTWLNMWDGSSWGTSVAAATAAVSINYPGIAVAFESTSGDALAIYGKASQTSVYYKTWNSASGWSSETTGPGVSAVPNLMILASDPQSDQIMLAVQNASDRLYYARWGGTPPFDTPICLETSTGGTSGYSQPFVFLWDQQPSSGSPNNNLGQLTGGTVGSGPSRFNATYTWGNGNKTLTVTVGIRVAGASNPTISTATWTFNPTTIVTKLLSSTGAFHICDTNAGGGNCLPSTGMTTMAPIYVPPISIPTAQPIPTVGVPIQSPSSNRITLPLIRR